MGFVIALLALAGAVTAIYYAWSADDAGASAADDQPGRTPLPGARDLFGVGPTLNDTRLPRLGC